MVLMYLCTTFNLMFDQLLCSWSKVVFVPCIHCTELSWKLTAFTSFLFFLAATSQHILEVSLNSTSIGREDLLGHTIDLTCSLINSSEVQLYNTLQWLDGELPIKQSSGREIIRCGTSITLRFLNFSLLDFGMYRCRCVNLFSFEEYKGENYNIMPFCSHPSNITLLPEGKWYT